MVEVAPLVKYATLEMILAHCLGNLPGHNRRAGNLSEIIIFL